MPTQIIDNFDLNTAKPLDNRLVVGPNSFYTTKDSITYKYEGMRVWDLNDGIPYVWTGTTFSSENNVAVTGNGLQNYLAKFGAASNVIGSSQIFDNVTSVGVGTNTPDPNYRLHVLGKIYASVGLVGNGSQVTNLSATNISSGLMGIQYLQGGNLGWILTADNSTTTSYKDPATINVGSATTLQNPRLIWGRSFNGQYDISGNITGAGTIQFGSATSKATLTYNTNKTVTLNVPDVGTTAKTFAFLEQSQVFSAVQSIVSTPDPFIVYATDGMRIGSRPNFKLSAYVNNTSFSIYRYTNSSYTTQKNSSWTSYGYPNNYEEIRFAGRTYINVTDNSALTFGTNGVNDRVGISSAGLGIGSNGTPISKMVVGRLSININGSAGTILAGSGFTFTMTGSGAALAARVDLSTPFPGVTPGSNPNGVVVLCQAVYNSSTSYFYCSSWTESSFTLRGINWSSGSVQVHFMAYSVS